MKFKLVEKFELNETKKDVYRYVYIEKDDRHYYDTVEAISYKQASFLAYKKHPDCMIRDVHVIVNNNEDQGEQLSFLDESYTSAFTKVIDYVKWLFSNKYKGTKWEYDACHVRPKTAGGGLTFRVEFDSNNKTIQDDFIKELENEFKGVDAVKGRGYNWDYYVVVDIDEQACNPQIAEDLVNYNANPQDRNTGDCTIRALSLAYNKSYNNVKSELHNLASNNHGKFNDENVVRAYLEKNGYKTKFDNTQQNLSTVEKFTKQHLHGCYVVFCSNKIKQDTSNSFHLVAVLDGVIYDTWDSSDYFVIEAWEIQNNSHNVLKQKGIVEN